MGLTASQRPGRPPPVIGALPVGPFRQEAFYQTGSADPRLRPDAGAGLCKPKAGDRRRDRAEGGPARDPRHPHQHLSRPQRHRPHGALSWQQRRGVRYRPRGHDRVGAQCARGDGRRVPTGTALPGDAAPGHPPFHLAHRRERVQLQERERRLVLRDRRIQLLGKGNRAHHPGKVAIRYDVGFEYRFFDRYDWDGGKKVTIGNIEVTDEFMGEFHRQGLAREFDCFGKNERHIVWEGAAAAATDQAVVHRPGR